MTSSSTPHRTAPPMLIGHLDSGVQRDAPLVKHRIASFRAIDRQGRATTPLLARDNGTHGTCTASILFGDHYPGLPSLPDCVKLFAVALEPQRRAILHVAAAIDTVLDVDVRIAFLPVGIEQRTPVFLPLIEVLCRRGVLVIAPIGNVGPGRACAPGYYSQVLSVGAMDERGHALPRSGSCRDDEGRCRKPDIMAPGCGIPGVKESRGTSMASAYATGVAARLWHAHPEASAHDIWQAMVSTAGPAGPRQGQSRGGALQPEKALAFLDGEHRISAPLSRPSGGTDVSGVYLDPRLKEQCAGKRWDELIEAILVPRAWSEAQKGHALRLVEDATRWSGEAPRDIRRFVHADMVHVRAPRRFCDALWEHPELWIASAVDVEAPVPSRMGGVAP